MKTSCILFCLVTVCLSWVQYAAGQGIYSIRKSAGSDSAIAVSAHPLASQIGIRIMHQGGNAVDASIAMQFALTVCYPAAGNVGGGGFMLYRSHQGEVRALDFRETAPAAAGRDMYLNVGGEAMTEKSQQGHLACGVPGSVAGLYEAYKKYSRLKNWDMLVQPAIDLAEHGVALTAREAEGLCAADSLFRSVNGRETVFNGTSWKEGDTLKQPELASTLKEIRDHGRDGFYRGKVAAQIIAEMQKGGGIITLEDLINYRAVWREAVQFTYRGHTIYSMPPPSSGGIALLQLFNSVEPFNLADMGMHRSETVHLMVEAERRAYADRASYLGDADFYKVPQKQLCDSQYILSRMASMDPEKATPSSDIQAGTFPESEQTTHLSVVDAEGNAVSVTTTLNGAYGSFVVVDGAGFILNNEMDDFSIKAGVANLYGLVGGEANSIAPGKRMLSSMSPCIVAQNGKLKMVVGTPGGSTIITTVFQVIVNVLDFQLRAAEAVHAPRFHHQWQPDLVYLEEPCLSQSVRRRLTKMGHSLKNRGPIGRVELIVVNEDGSLEGAADPRGDDAVSVY